ncbi:AarF/ABC1/UbiB kinase family protein [Oscillochloris sp. ZM17-4]|uniref:ABC1 kinase family protein n=1 Tax=Oscillochloris sp. ZM17-4 TaxID=2866714 RepID=UPI001C73DB2A|nr:AarF/UbiB family protein [Oscillochloris sp. ZM17-4]MBX0327558.1 AarF/ABC1/UbiB kinase family protein [Oscillochloris sp. ZM17-4]
MSDTLKIQISQPTPIDHTATPPPSAPPQFRPRERFLRVLLFFLGVVAHIYIWDIFLQRFALMRWYVRRTQMRRWATIARRFRTMAIELGGMQIKLGQFLSSRADIVPQEVRRELAGLQDEVPPAPPGHVLEVILEELGALPSQIFETFEPEAVAAASLGQVHFATLKSGRLVAVKVQRPYIEKIIEVDLSAVTWVVRLIKNYPPIRRRADMEALLAEFGRVLVQELDYVSEAKNADSFRANFAGIPGVYTPEIIHELSTRRVLVMERISGVKVNDLRTLDSLGVSRLELAARLSNTYLKQFYVDGLFHADPHPGNLFVRVEPEHPLAVYQNGQVAKDDLASGAWIAQTLTGSSQDDPPAKGAPFTLIFVDFGMVGHLTPHTMEVMRSGVIGLATNDPERIVDSLDKMNMILAGADRRLIVRGIQSLLRLSYNRTMREMTNLDVDLIFDETRDIIYDLPFQIPQDLLYLGRALSMVGGLATEICPDINLFDELRPFARMMMDREQQEGNWAERVQKELVELGQILLKLPRQMDEYYGAANRGDMQTRSDTSRLERGMRRVERSNDRLAGGMFAASLFLGGVQLRTRGMEREASRAWWGAIAAALWAFWPRGER